MTNHIPVVVDVHHLSRGLQSRGSPVVHEEFIHVATVFIVAEADDEIARMKALNRAFRLTNNIDSSWSLQPASGVDVVAPFPVLEGEEVGHRSTSVGDRMSVTINGVSTWYDVAFIGFEEVIF